MLNTYSDNIYPDIDMWVDLNAIRSYIANSNVSFENRTVQIRPALSSQNNRHCRQWQLII